MVDEASRGADDDEEPTEGKYDAYIERLLDVFDLF